MKLKTLVPMIAVKDIRAAFDFYTNELEFALVSPEKAIDEWKWCHLEKDSVRIMLAQTDIGHLRPSEETTSKEDMDHYFSCCLYFYPDDVQALFNYYKNKGVGVTELKKTFYGMNEFSVRDPDGYLLSFGQDLEDSE